MSLRRKEEGGEEARFIRKIICTHKERTDHLNWEEERDNTVEEKWRNYGDNTWKNKRRNIKRSWIGNGRTRKKRKVHRDERKKRSSKEIFRRKKYKEFIRR